nr:hypothetical protein [Mesorhizobium prunaredense]
MNETERLFTSSGGRRNDDGGVDHSGIGLNDLGNGDAVGLHPVNKPEARRDLYRLIAFFR